MANRVHRIKLPKKVGHANIDTSGWNTEMDEWHRIHSIEQKIGDATSNWFIRSEMKRPIKTEKDRIFETREEMVSAIFALVPAFEASWNKGEWAIDGSGRSGFDEIADEMFRVLFVKLETPRSKFAENRKRGIEALCLEIAEKAHPREKKTDRAARVATMVEKLREVAEANVARRALDFTA